MLVRFSVPDAGAPVESRALLGVSIRAVGAADAVVEVLRFAAELAGLAVGAAMA